MHSQLTLPEKVFKIRQHLGYKVQDEFGAAIGLGKGSISAWERGHVKRIPAKWLDVMALKFGINPNYLMGLSDQMLIEDAPMIVQEEAEKYIVDPSDLISERFMRQVTVYSQRSGYKTNRDLAFELGCISEDMLSKISTGSRTASLDIIYRCGSKMKINFNYTMYGIGAMFYKAEKEWEEEIDRLKRMVDILMNTSEQRKLA